MIRLDETDETTKGLLKDLMTGRFTGGFEPSQLEYLKKRSFLLNHLAIEETYIEFEFNGNKIRVRHDDPIGAQIYGMDMMEWALAQIQSQSEFGEAWAAFSRDYKIDSIIGK